MIVMNEEAHVKNISGALILQPGLNDVDPQVWERVVMVGDGAKKKMHPTVAYWIEEGEITVQDANPKMQDLAELSVKDAAALVKKTLSLDLLNLWVESEERSGVVKALKEQLKLLEVKPDKSAQESDEE